ncbi:MAG: hypothetical protein ACD_22C00206G0003 [uncultured bacterium]|nr:MAG: hypothetical protein ACD_22C00206G0003 [uncultured bacterium]
MGDKTKKRNGEKLLRKQVYDFLVEYLGSQNVEDCCGQYEFGCDLIFYQNDPFGIKRRYGIQLKDTDLNGTEINEVLGQLCIAFGHRFATEDRLLDGVYIITSGTITRGAFEKIKEANIGFRNVWVLDKNLLSPALVNKTNVNKFQQGINKEI